jgi:hypothetical protein
VLRCDEALNDEPVTAREMIMEMDYRRRAAFPGTKSPNEKDRL